MAPEGASLAETNKNLDAVVKVLKEEQQRTGIKLLWGTANLFSNPRYVHGAATSPNADAFAFAAAQVKKALEVTKELGGAGLHVLGRPRGLPEPLEHRHEARARPPGQVHAHGRRLRQAKSASRGSSTSSPSPRSRPSTSTISTAPACINFLRAYGLADHVKMNIETNHATLAGHTMQHEMEYAGAQGFLGSIDANTGDLLLGWDTDQFPTDIYLTTKCMLVLLKYGGFTTGGLNFDAKVRRESFEPVDLFHAHIGGMDAFARGLKIAAAIRADGELDKLRQAALRLLGQRRRRRDRGRQARLRLAGEVHARQGRRHAQHQRPAGNAGEHREPVRVLDSTPTVKLLALLLLGMSAAVARAESSADRQAYYTTPYNVAWTWPSHDAAGSMPLGNGQVGINLWVEEDGDLRFYISRNDSFTETARLVKVGGVRISLDPNPFKTGMQFRQELILRDGMCEITAGDMNTKGDVKTGVKLKVYVDAAAPVICIEGISRATCPGQSFRRQLALETAFACRRGTQVVLDVAQFTNSGDRVGGCFPACV